VANVKRHLEKWLDRGAVRAVLSIGFAGALSPSLEVGDLVIANEVRDAKGKPDSTMLSAARGVQITGRPPRLGVALTSHEILWRAESKRAVADSLAADEIGFVDMESTAIAEVCARCDVPFLITRAITDLLDEDLPLDFNQHRDRSGRIDNSKVVGAAILRPRVLLRLLDLRNRSELCAERLAQYVCRLAPAIAESLGPGSKL
jgi:adenosylhomocysteine nucleosidase